VRSEARHTAGDYDPQVYFGVNQVAAVKVAPRYTALTLTGPFFVMNLVGAGGAVGQQFYEWYCVFAFPSTEWDAKSDSEDTVRTVSKSPLCHESRTIWENALLRQWNRAAPYDDSRCKKLPCDTVKQAVRMLNDWRNGTPVPAWAADADYATCYSCHTTLYTDQKVGASYPSGKENCRNCHDVPAAHGHPTGRRGEAREPIEIRAVGAEGADQLASADGAAPDRSGAAPSIRCAARSYFSAAGTKVR